MTAQRTGRGAAQARKAGAAAAGAEARYDAAGLGRRIRSWTPPSTGPQRAVEGLQRIRDRARDVSRNDWAGSSASQKWATNLVGVAITPRWKNKALRDAWKQHVKVADADCVLDAYGMMTLGTRSWFDSGEVFLRRRPRDLNRGLPAPVQYQLIESDYVPLLDSDSWPGLPQGNTIRQGIERSRYGERTAYWVYKEHPGDGSGHVKNPDLLVRVAASQMSHMFEPTRPGALRGVSQLASVLTRLRNAGNFEDAVLDRQMLANLFVAFITRQMPDWEDVDVDAVTGLPKFYDRAGNPLAGLQPGMMQELLPGENVAFANPPEAGTTYSEYMRTTHLGTAAGAGLPYELMSGDIKDISDRTLRVVINEFRRLARQRQWQIIIPRLCQPMVDWWADALVLKGDLSIAAAEDAKTSVVWHPEGWEYIHPTQDAEGKKILLDAGLISRARVVGERGDDVEEIDEERAEDLKRSKAMGLEPPPPPKPVAPAPTPKPSPKAEAIEDWQLRHVQAIAMHAEHALAQAKEPPQAPETSPIEHFVAGLAGVQASVADVAASVAALAARPTQVDVHVPTPTVNVEAPTVNLGETHVHNEVNPTPITNQVDVPAPVVHVAAPTVNVEAKAGDVTLQMPDRKVVTKLDRDPNTGDMTGSTAIETTIKPKRD